MRKIKSFPHGDVFFLRTHTHTHTHTDRASFQLREEPADDIIKLHSLMAYTYHRKGRLKTIIQMQNEKLFSAERDGGTVR